MNTIAHKDEWEMAEKEAIKVARTAITLKHRLLADRELNEVLPELQATVRQAIAEGRAWEADIAGMFEVGE